MNINMAGRVEGFYGIKIRRNAGLENEFIEDCGEHQNLILDGLFTRWLSGSLRSSSWRFFVGTGATAPAVTDTQLVAQLGSASGAATVTVNATAIEGLDYVSSSTGVASWAIGDIIGNISEIGVSLSTSTSGLSLDSRALIVDGVGAPTTLTVTALDQLVVSYTLRYKIPTAQHISAVTFKGVSTTCTLETVGVLDTFHWGLGVVFDSTYPFRCSTTPKISNAASIQNNVEANLNFGTAASCTVEGSNTGAARRVTFTASPEQWNAVGDIEYILIMSTGSLGRQGIHFNPKINKTNTDTLILNFDYTLARV